jgi:hypothetical protein
MIKDQLLREAKEAATRLDQQKRGLDAKVVELEEKKLAAELAFKNASLAHQRALDFQPSIGGDFQCPTCWVERGERRTLRNIKSDSDAYDIWRCTVCADRKIPI